MDSTILKTENESGFENLGSHCQFLSFTSHYTLSSEVPLGTTAATVPPVHKCGEIFISEDDLFNFLCTFCESSFEEIDRFFVHVKRVHPKERNGIQERTENLSFESCKENTNLDSNIQIVVMDDIKMEPPQSTDETIDPLCTPSVSQMIENSTHIKAGPSQITSEENSHTFPSTDCIKTEVEEEEEIEETDERKCRYCDHTFSDSTRQKEHERTHIEEKPYRCNLCEQTFKTSTALSYHNIKHVLNRGHRCQTCNRYFSTSHKLKCHLVTHTGEKPYACTYCDAKFGHSSSLRRHKKIHADNTKSFCSETGVTSNEGLDGQCNSEEENNAMEGSSQNNSSIKIRIQNESSLSASQKNETFKFNCGKCGMKFASKQSLIYHQKYPLRCIKNAIKKETRIKREQKMTKDLDSRQLDRRKCRYCDRIFSKFKRRIVHERIKHTGERPFQCYVCEKLFACTDLLNRHLRRSKCNEHRGKKDVKSSTTEFTKIKENLNDPANSWNNEVDEVNESTNKFESKEKLSCEAQCESKEVELDDDDTYTCEICKKPFIGYANLETHKTQTLCNIIQDLLEDESDDNEDSVVNEHSNVNSSTLLQSQLTPVSGFTEEKIKCKMCCIEFNSREDVIKHLENSVTCIKKAIEKQENTKAANKRKCRYCNRVLSNSRRRKEHEGIHTGEKPYQCRFCGKLFRLWSYVSVHEKTHTVVDQLKCDICNLTFKTKNILHAHKKRHGEKKFPCSFCDMSFFNPRERKYHERTHTGEKPYKCDLCEKSFVSSGSFNYHRKTHSGIRPYQCKYCPLSFNTTQRLKYHNITHTGKKPYTCPVCDAELSHASSLKRHEKVHSNIEKFVCKMCGATFKRFRELCFHVKGHKRRNDQAIE